MDDYKELEIEFNEDNEPLVWQCPHCSRCYNEDVAECDCNLETY